MAKNKWSKKDPIINFEKIYSLWSKIDPIGYRNNTPNATQCYIRVSASNFVVKITDYCT